MRARVCSYLVLAGDGDDDVDDGDDDDNADDGDYRKRSSLQFTEPLLCRILTQPPPFQLSQVVTNFQMLKT